jgi:hypothetical protein
MKAFLWLVTLSITWIAVWLWILTMFTSSYLQESGWIVPRFTRAIITDRVWLLVLPIPWAIASGILSAQKEISLRSILLFLGASILGVSIIVLPVLVGLALPWLTTSRLK